jgi:hypothetical protein
MSAALQPVNEKFPSPDEIANKHIKQLAEDLQYSDHCKLWIKGIYKESTGGDKATVKVMANYVAGVEVLYPLYVAQGEDNKRMFASHEVNMKALLELKELKDIVKVFFANITDNYPSEQMNIKRIFGTSQEIVKPKFFKEL